MEKPFILILCTGNSCRSQMAEAVLRREAGDLVDVASAGAEPSGYVHPKAVQVMDELGIDISANRSKHLSEFLDRTVHTVITVCGNADEACPIFPGAAHRYHWAFEDPARANGSDEQVLDVFRRVRNEIVKIFGAYAAGIRLRVDHAKLFFATFSHCRGHQS